MKKKIKNPDIPNDLKDYLPNIIFIGTETLSDNDAENKKIDAEFFITGDAVSLANAIATHMMRHEDFRKLICMAHFAYHLETDTDESDSDMSDIFKN